MSSVDCVEMSEYPVIAASHRTATPEDLQALAGFQDSAGNAISFYFKAGEGKIAARDAMIAHWRARSIISDSFGREKPCSGLLRDLDAVMKISEEAGQQHDPDDAPMKIVFACHDQGIWEEFDLPSGKRIVRIEAGKRFDLAPLQRLLQPSALDDRPKQQSPARGFGKGRLARHSR